MSAIFIADKLVSMSRVGVLLALLALPLNTNAEYYLVYGPPVCDVCGGPQPYYRPVYRTHRVKTYKHIHHKKYYYRTAYRHRSHYSITVYYPVAVYTRPPCGCCGGFMEPTYYWAPEPYRVYYEHSDDRLVGNGYDEELHDPSIDTGTADNDIY